MTAQQLHNPPAVRTHPWRRLSTRESQTGCAVGRPHPLLRHAQKHTYTPTDTVVTCVWCCSCTAVGGNHEASNYLRELFYGGWAAPNIYFMGFAGEPLASSTVMACSKINKPTVSAAVAVVITHRSADEAELRPGSTSWALQVIQLVAGLGWPIPRPTSQL
jgi:hypothetical protein